MSIEDDFLKALKKLRECEMRRCKGMAFFEGYGFIGCAFPDHHSGRCSARVGGHLFEWSEEYSPEKVMVR